jgi:hypothetical protein
MSAPRRLLDGSLSARERRALSAGLGLAPSHAARARMWKGVAAGVGVVGALTASKAAVAAGASA